MADKNKEKEMSEMDKLMKLTKLMKEKKINVAKVASSNRSTNKWRNDNAKFVSTTPPKPTEGTVEAGGMNVDASLKDDYDAWRKQKEEEQKFFRDQQKKKPYR